MIVILIESIVALSVKRFGELGRSDLDSDRQYRDSEHTVF